MGGGIFKKGNKGIIKVPAESIYDKEVSHHACDAHSQDDNSNSVVSVVRDVYSWKWVVWNHGLLGRGNDNGNYRVDQWY